MHCSLHRLIWSAEHMCCAIMQDIANRMLALREILPHCDLSALVARFPALLLELEPSAVAAQLSDLR